MVRVIGAELPGVEVLYVADSAHAPYGTKPPGQVRERAEHITAFLLAEGADAIVVACNTATAMAVEHLRMRFACPIIAMEPAVKPAVAATRSGVVGVLATAGTLESERYRILIEQHGSRARVLGRVCQDWVELVEHADLEAPTTRARVAADVRPLLAAGADTLVLGCTHFPFLAPLITDIAGPDVTLIDPAPAVVRELRRRLPLPAAPLGPGRPWRIWSSRVANDEAVRIRRVCPVALAPAVLP